MNNGQLICPLFGSAVEPDAKTACAACPLHTGCTLVCCPTCGYTVINPERTRLAGALIRLSRVLRQHIPTAASLSNGQCSLADAPVGIDLRIIARDGLAQEYSAWLQAYGVQPGHSVRVLQQRPVTVVRAGQDELALEPAIAQMVRVQVYGAPAAT
jgi:Fe2+ transport system protein FeoA